MFAAAAFHQQQQKQQKQQAEHDYPEVCTTQPVITNASYTPQQLAPNPEFVNPVYSSLYPAEKTIEAQATSAYAFPQGQPYHASSAHSLVNANYSLATQSASIVAYPPEKTPYVDPQPGVYLPEKPRYVGPQQQMHLPGEPQFNLISQPQQLPLSPSISSGKSIYDLPPPPPYTSQAPICGPDTSFYPQQTVQIPQVNRTQVDEPQPLVYIPPAKPKDEKKSGTAKRFLGDTLVGRFAREKNIPGCVASADR